MDITARKLFHGKERYNCAQAILAAYKTKLNVACDVITEYKSYGGGRAEGGLCGALFAGLFLLKDDTAAQDKLKAHFKEQAGSLTCKQVRKSNKISCAECVATTAGFLEELVN